MAQVLARCGCGGGVEHQLIVFHALEQHHARGRRPSGETVDTSMAVGSGTSAAMMRHPASG